MWPATVYRTNGRYCMSEQDERSKRPDEKGERCRYPGRVALDCSTLLEDVAAFEDALDGPAPVAVIGEPFAGRELILDHATERLGAKRVVLTPSADASAVVDQIGSEPVVFENCQHLFDRRIGGFDGLAAALGAIAGADTPVVTGWNSYAWTYLDAVQDVGTDFEQYPLEAIPRDALVEVIRSEVGSLPTFEAEELDETPYKTKRVELDWPDYDFSVPVPDAVALKRRLTPISDPKRLVFSRLQSVSNGNPGVAVMLWNRCCTESTVAPSAIQLPSLDVDHDGAFLLRLALAAETIHRELLEEWFGNRLDRYLGTFQRNNLLREDGRVVRIEPLGVPVAHEITNTKQIL